MNKIRKATQAAGPFRGSSKCLKATSGCKPLVGVATGRGDEDSCLVVTCSGELA